MMSPLLACLACFAAYYVAYRYCGGVLFGLAVWLVVEAAAAARRYRSEPPFGSLEVEFPER
jgi:hypothetical protein